MAEKCWICKKFEEHFYWEHMEETRIQFIKVMEGDFCHGMEFPKKFSRNFRVELPNLITLEAPNGKLWKINLLKEEDRFYLKDGWKEFINDYGTKEGYSLLFKYAGNSSFAVKFFDQTGCVVGDTSNVAMYDNGVDDEARNLKMPQFPKVEVSSSSLQVLSHCQLGHEISLDIISSNGGSSVEVMHCKREFEGGLEDQCVKPSEIAWKGYTRKEEIRLKRNLWPQAKGGMENCEDILQHFNPNRLEKYSFVKLVKKTHLTKDAFMVIPCGFVAEHFHEKPTEIILRERNGRCWPVSLKSSKCSFGLSGESFYHFAQDNNLEVDDACIFDLINIGTEVVMDVIVVRSAEIYWMRKSLTGKSK